MYENNFHLYFTGHFKIYIERLEFGQQIRPIDDSFVKYLKRELTEFADECYQPVCALVEDIPIPVWWAKDTYNLHDFYTVHLHLLVKACLASTPGARCGCTFQDTPGKPLLLTPGQTPSLQNQLLLLVALTPWLSRDYPKASKIKIWQSPWKSSLVQGTHQNLQVL